MRLAKVLNLDSGEVFFLARPHARPMLNLSPDNSVLDARKRFKKIRCFEASSAYLMRKWKCCHALHR
jgi:hypothetical protein